jgi:LemA protein
MMQQFYAGKYSMEEPGEVTYSPHYYPSSSRIYPLVAVVRSNWVRLTFFLASLFLIVGTIYYYNLLVTTEQDVLAAGGKVEALLQRRNDISINLSKAVLDYSKHERGVFTAVTGLRSILTKESINNPELKALLGKLEQPGATAPNAAEKSGKIIPALDPSSPLAGLMAVAEQYPDLKLSAAFQNLMTALIDVEKDLAGQRINYNDSVNTYTTNFKRFPVNVFALLFRFESRPYFEATEEARKLVPIKY